VTSKRSGTIKALDIHDKQNIYSLQEKMDEANQMMETDGQRYLKVSFLVKK